MGDVDARIEQRVRNEISTRRQRTRCRCPARGFLDEVVCDAEGEVQREVGRRAADRKYGPALLDECLERGGGPRDRHFPLTSAPLGGHVGSGRRWCRTTTTAPAARSCPRDR